MKIQYTVRRKDFKKVLWYLIDYATILQIDIIKTGSFFSRSYIVEVEGMDHLVTSFIEANEISEYSKIY